MRIGIFGGSFNPPHLMHKKIALSLVKVGYLDRVIMVPTGSRYHYKNNLVLDKYRLEMLEMITQDSSCLDVSDYELKSREVYTYQTLKYFRELYPNDEIYFVCGVDNLSYMDKWMNGIEILSNYKIIVINRGNDDIGSLLDKYQKYRDNIIVSDIERSDISSTKIRELVREKNYDEALGYLDKGVMAMIRDKGLYLD